MNKELAGLSDEELMQRIKSVFFFPLDLERLHSYSKKRSFEVASLDEVVLFYEIIKRDETFEDERLEAIKNTLKSGKDLIRLYCLSKGYCGLIHATRIVEQFNEMVGTINFGYEATEDHLPNQGLKLITVHSEPYKSKVSIPQYALRTYVGISGLPVKEIKYGSVS